MAEVASVGGFVKQYNIILNPQRMRDLGITMQKMRDEAEQAGGEPKAEEVKDELEKSIVARLADDIRVGIRGDKAEVVIEKVF